MFAGLNRALERNHFPAEGIQDAKDLTKAITVWLPSGSDEGTFMECTQCHRFVCPACCSVCPHPSCGDRMCHVSFHIRLIFVILIPLRIAIHIGDGSFVSCMVVATEPCIGFHGIRGRTGFIKQTKFWRTEHSRDGDVA